MFEDYLRTRVRASKQELSNDRGSGEAICPNFTYSIVLHSDCGCHPDSLALQSKKPVIFLLSVPKDLVDLFFLSLLLDWPWSKGCASSTDSISCRCSFWHALQRKRAMEAVSHDNQTTQFIARHFGGRIARVLRLAHSGICALLRFR